MLERDEICLEKDSVESYETEIFVRQARYYGYGVREGERGVDYFTGLLRRPTRRNSVLEGLRVK